MQVATALEALCSAAAAQTATAAVSERRTVRESSMEMAPAATLSEHACHPYSRLLWSAGSAHTGRRASASSGWELSEQERPKEGCRFRARCAVYRAMGEPSICREKDSEPELLEIAPQHHVRCHFPEGESIEA